MPYVITTRPPTRSAGYGIPDRTAVATLDDPSDDATTARSVARAIVRDHGGDIDALDTITELPESGGTVGPLSDGTVIEVRRVTLAELAGSPVAHYNARHTADVIATFNARQ